MGLVCPLLPSLSIPLTQLISFSSFQCVLGTSLNVRSEFQRVSQTPPNDRQIVDPSGSKRTAESITSLVLQCLLQRGEQHTGSCWQYPVLGCPWSALASLCPESPGTKSQVLNPYREFRWQFLSHTLLCSLSDSLKRCLCMLFLLPNPFGIQPCWGTSNTTGSCVLFLGVRVIRGTAVLHTHLSGSTLPKSWGQPPEPQSLESHCFCTLIRH